MGVGLTRAGLRRVGAPGGLRGADARAGPRGDGSVGLLVAVAVVHHLHAVDRQRVYAECARLLGPDGRGLISVWAVDHPRFDADEGFDATIPWTRPDGSRVDRFYHIFDAAEFRAELASSALAPAAVFAEAGNPFAVVGG